jgi:hypothetical protein
MSNVNEACIKPSKIRNAAFPPGLIKAFSQIVFRDVTLLMGFIFTLIQRAKISRRNSVDENRAGQVSRK